MYIAEINARVAGIPCVIGVSHYNCVKGSYSSQEDSDWDYYGYNDAEWDVCDRNGRKAPWLASKMTKSDVVQIEAIIAQYFDTLEADL